MNVFITHDFKALFTTCYVRYSKTIDCAQGSPKFALKHAFVSFWLTNATFFFFFYKRFIAVRVNMFVHLFFEHSRRFNFSPLYKKKFKNANSYRTQILSRNSTNTFGDTE